MLFRLLCLVMFCPEVIIGQVKDSLIKIEIDSLIKSSRKFSDEFKFVEAIEFIKIAEQRALLHFDSISIEYGKVAYNLGKIYYLEGANNEAETWLLRAESIQKKVLEDQHPDYVLTLISLGVLYDDIGFFSKAEPLLLKVNSILEKKGDIASMLYAGNLNNLGLLYSHFGKYEKAVLYLYQALDIVGKIKSKSHLNYISSQVNLANLLMNMGNFEKAEALLLEAKLNTEKIEKMNNPEYSMILYSLGLLYKKLSNFNRAEQFLLEAIIIDKQVTGINHIDYITDIIGLGNLYYDIGKYSLGEAYYLEAKAILEKNSGTLSTVYTSVLHNLAGLYSEIGDFFKAESLYIETKLIRKQVLGDEHPDYATTLNNFGLLYFDMGNFSKAETLIIEAMHIRERVLGKTHPDFSWSLMNLASLYQRMNRLNESEIYFTQSIDLKKQHILLANMHLSEFEMQKYLSSYTNQFDKIYSFAQTRKDSSSILGLCFDNILFYKGFMLNTANQIRRLVVKDSVTSEQFDILKSYGRQLAKQYSKPLILRDQFSIKDLEDKTNLLEKELSRSVAGFGEAIQLLQWKEVRDALKPGEAAIEFIHFNTLTMNKVDSTYYAALLLKPNENQPIFIPLFEEKSLDTLFQYKSELKVDQVNNFYSIANRGVITLKSPKRTLYEVLWQPMEKYLEGTKSIYFSASGLLHRLNLNAIPVAETEVLADRYQLFELNSTRQLVIPTQINQVNNEAILFGGIQFDQDSNSKNIEPLIVSRSRGELSFTSVDSTLRGGSWNYLPGSEREINAIEKIMNTSGVQATLKKGYFATEESFKNLGINNSPSPRIVHIATHGYFFPDQKSNSQQSVVNSQSESVFKMSDHPMLRSGLIMAGGNAAWQGKQTLEGREDGILTAYEISQMNLSNTELVVLSACETGLGDIQGNEGVYGLQRAFKIAGAKYLIMSLWQVPDKQTSLLMTAFYRKWLENKMTIPNAFHAAQKELRDLGLDPYQWAGFVLVE